MTNQIKQIFSKIEDIIKNQSFDNYKITVKDDGTFVSSVDIELQSKFIEIIVKQFPHHNILSEEITTERIPKRESLFTWVIDPIDGTKNFIDGKKEFSSSIGLMKGNEFIAALVVFPKLDESYSGFEGKGIYCNSKPFNFQKNKNSNEIILCSKTYPKNYELLHKMGYEVNCFYCATYSMLRLLKKNGILYHTINTKLYDVGPMSFILNLAGFNVLNSSFQKLNFEPELKNIPFFLTSIDKKTIRNIFINA